MANMEDLLDLYAEPYDPRRPVVCFDETSTQLLADTRPSLPSRPGIPLRQDYEYRREGVRNLFLTCEPLAGWRHVAVTRRRTMEDFAHQMHWLVDEAYPDTRSGGPADCQTAGVPLHPQARKLVEHGGNRVQRASPLLLEAATPRRGGPPPGSPCSG